MNISRGKQTHREATVYHEAGHALAALREGRQVGGVFLSATDAKAGVCFFQRGLRNPYDVSHNAGSAAAAWHYTFESSCAEIRISLAGPLAEAKVLGKPLRELGSWHDFENCLYLSNRLFHLSSFISNYTEIASVNPSQLLETEKQKVYRWLRRSKVSSTICLV